MDCGRRRKRGGGLEAVPVGGESFLARYVLYVPTGYSTVMPVMLIHPLTSTSLSP